MAEYRLVSNKELRKLLNKAWDEWVAPFYKEKYERRQERNRDRNRTILPKWPPGKHWCDEENYRIWMSNRRYRDVCKILKEAEDRRLKPINWLKLRKSNIMEGSNDG